MLKKLHATVPTPYDTCCNCALAPLLAYAKGSHLGNICGRSVVWSAQDASLLGVQADRLLLQVAPFFIQLEDEAGGLKQMPSGCAVKLGNKAAGVHISEAGLVAEVVPHSGLKAPASIEEEAKVPNLCLANNTHINIYIYI